MSLERRIEALEAKEQAAAGVVVIEAPFGREDEAADAWHMANPEAEPGLMVICVRFSGLSQAIT